MKLSDRNPETMLNRAIEGVSGAQPDPAAVREAARRAWSRIAEGSRFGEQDTGSVHGCAGFQSLIPDFQNRSLSPARALLVQDHLNECVVCRKFAQARLAPAAVPNVIAMPVRSAAPWRKYAVAAALLVAVGLPSYWAWENLGLSADGPRATVQRLDGVMYRVTSAGLRPVASGEALNEAEIVRTGAGAKAVLRLRDGSTVEVNERAEFSVSARASDTTLRLERGAIIVQAAKRRSGHLYVASSDSRVSVTGTIFSVNRGVAGSRVSVVEGEVRVEQGSETRVLRPGDQTSTHASVGASSLVDEISWSERSNEYLALLREITALTQKLDSVHMPGLRYASRLLDVAPSSTVVFASIPNLGQVLGEAHTVFENQLRQSPVLRAWWQKNPGMSAEIEQAITKIRNISSYLGDEIALALPMRAGFRDDPVIFAEVKREGLRQFLEREVKIANAPFTIWDGVGPLNGGGTIVLLRGGYVAILENPDDLREMVQRFDSPAANPFSATPFGKRLRDAFAQGAGMLLAGDTERLSTMSGVQQEMQSSGFSDARSVIIQQKQVGSEVQHSASISFAGPRRGIASWIARSAPVGSLTYVSPEAQVAVSAVVKNPAEMFDDVLRVTGSEFLKELKEAETQLGLRVRDDIASALGGDATFALDGALLPVPSWKFIVEVTNPSLLQRSLERVAAEMTREAVKQGGKGVEVVSQTEDGQTWHTFRSLDVNRMPEMHYVFHSGYLVAGPSRSVVQKALQTRNSRTYLTRSQHFLDLLPRDRDTNFSALVYQNAGGTISALMRAGSMGNAAGADDLAQALKPMVITAYGGADSLEFSSKANTLHLAMQMLLPAMVHGTSPERVAYRK